MKLSRREKRVTILFISIIVFVLYFFYFYQPIIAETEDIIIRLSALERDVKNSRTLGIELKRLNDRLASLYDEVDFLYNDIFGGISQAEIILFIEDLIRPLGLKKTIRFEEIVDYKAYRVAKMTVCMDTNYSNLKRIIQGIEQSPWKNRIEQMRSVVKDRGGLVSEKYNVEVEMTIGFYCP